LDSDEAYFYRKDLDFLRSEYTKVDWRREKTATVTEVTKLREELEQLWAKQKEFDQILSKIAEEERKPVSRE